MIPEGYELLLSKQTIEERISEMAKELAADIGDRPVTFVGILDGALFFLTDLIRSLAIDAQIDFLRISSYRGGMSSGELKMLSGITWNIRDRYVVVVDDILDTGQTLAYCENHLYELGASKVRSVVLLTKDRHREFMIENPLIGFTIPDHFVIGYGLDLEGKYRHLTDIYHLEKQP